jgi:hypothetical protein
MVRILGVLLLTVAVDGLGGFGFGKKKGWGRRIVLVML